MQTFSTLEVDLEDGIATVTLNRPELLNRFDALLHVELADCFSALRGDPDVRTVILASTGKVFSAGGDIELMLEAHASMQNRLRIVDDARRLLGVLVDLPQPLVVALHGDAIGLAATVALTGDAIVAARTAHIADPHVQFALVAGDGGCVLWPAAMGIPMAKRYLLTGDRVPALLAHQMGLVSDLVDEPGDVLPAARTLATRMAALPPLAVQGTKRALNRVLQARMGEVFDLSAAHEVWTLGSEDLLEAIAAFKERRPAQFAGR